MAVIVLKFADIEGESTVSGFENQADAIALRESIEVAAPVGSRIRGARTVGQAKFSDIEITRFKDAASPKLSEACSAGRNLGEVGIHLFRTLETGTVPYMTYTLSEVFVSRIENETLDEQGVALYPHLADSANVAPPSALGAAGLVFSNLRDLRGGRAAVRAIAWAPKTSYSNLEIERVYLSAAQVGWAYTKFVDGRNAGAIAKGWNVQQGIEA